MSPQTVKKVIVILVLFMNGPEFMVELRAQVSPSSDLRRGEYLTRVAGCGHCHSTRADLAWAGGLPLETPFGTFFTPNISSDPHYGIGQWTEANFRRALRDGRAPDGTFYYPAFPYRSYTKLLDRDIREMFEYMRTVPAVPRPNLPQRVQPPYDQRWLLAFWQDFFLRGRSSDPETNVRTGYGPFEPVITRSPTWNRGAYLVEALLHCAECHTPRNWFGAPIESQWLAGSELRFGGKRPPNITPDPNTGLGRWSATDWSRFLASGINPENRSPGGEMAQVIQTTSGLTREDREAVVEYLMTLKPVSSAGETK